MVRLLSDTQFSQLMLRSRFLPVHEEVRRPLRSACNNGQLIESEGEIHLTKGVVRHIDINITAPLSRLVEHNSREGCS